MSAYRPEVRWRETVRGRRTPVAVFEFDAEDCENVAGMMGSDGWARDLLDSADHLRELTKPDPDAPGLAIIVIYKGGTQVYS